ncbi:IS200/IS605 family transposase, partial [Paracoccus litorisediminis]|uniref:IS200/IS605 family transposase n=1 Tax=Paracoccus litorisediminis TaxID=2006130 RepID=UPI0037323EC1
VSETVKASIATACEIAQMQLLAIETGMDHVHVFVSARPSVSPADIARTLKGASSRAVRKDHPAITAKCGERGLWAQSYYVGTVGDMSAETVRHYIEKCQGK